MLLACLGHDIGHPGTNNLFQINSRHELAVMYNDQSVLENHHAAELIRLLSQPYGKNSKKLFGHLTDSMMTKERKVMVDLILSTDMSKHMQDLSDFRLRLGTASFNPVTQTSDQQMALSWLFRSSDLSHSSKPWNIHRAWSDRVVQEFHAQGDEEKRLDLPVSPLCDRDGFCLPKSQAGFLQFVCIPVFTEIARLEKLIVSLAVDTVEVPNRTSRSVLQAVRKVTTDLSGRQMSNTSGKPTVVHNFVEQRKQLVAESLSHMNRIRVESRSNGSEKRGSSGQLAQVWAEKSPKFATPPGQLRLGLPAPIKSKRQSQSMGNVGEMGLIKGMSFGSERYRDAEARNEVLAEVLQTCKENCLRWKDMAEDLEDD